MKLSDSLEFVIQHGAVKADLIAIQSGVKQLQSQLDTANGENERLRKKVGICKWTYDDTDDDFWDTSCGESYCFMEGGIKDNRVVFCHRCGRLVEEILPPREESTNK